tara:strand:- start:74 stop:265 length:192 start_codon:yes stop_codon:yes gene_type:complete
MNITSAQYVNEYDFDGTTVLNSNIHIEVVIDDETLSVPLDPANRHYAAILEWVAEGNTIQDAE